jgi:hypothetical protein
LEKKKKEKEQTGPSAPKVCFGGFLWTLSMAHLVRLCAKKDAVGTAFNLNIEIVGENRPMGEEITVWGGFSVSVFLSRGFLPLFL